MILFGVTNGYGNAATGDVIEFFSTREDAEQFIRECLADEPEWATILRVEAVELEFVPN